MFAPFPVTCLLLIQFCLPLNLSTENTKHHGESPICIAQRAWTHYSVLQAIFFLPLMLQWSATRRLAPEPQKSKTHRPCSMSRTGPIRKWKRSCLSFYFRVFSSYLIMYKCDEIKWLSFATVYIAAVGKQNFCLGLLRISSII